MVHAAIATGSLTMNGCVARVLLDPALTGDGSDSDGTDSDMTTGDSDDPTRPTSPTDPSDPTNPTNPTDPTTPTDPTVDPTGYSDGPPQLIDVQMISPVELELTFNEAMADPATVDVSSFRLSLAYANYYADYYEWGGTFYNDLSRWTGEETCYEYCWCKYYPYKYCEEYYYCDEWCEQTPGPPINPASLVAHSSLGTKMIMRLDSPVPSTVCNALQEFQEQWNEAGLFLHYSNNSAPLVTDRQGELLAPIAEHWVLPPQRDYDYNQGYFDAMIPFIPIPCPF